MGSTPPRSAGNLFARPLEIPVIMCYNFYIWVYSDMQVAAAAAGTEGLS
jgi:hypothetical protein